MIVIADGGATKCDWAFVENGEIVERMKMEGINPFSVPEEHIREVVASGVSSLKIEGRMKAPAYVYGVTKIS